MSRFLIAFFVLSCFGSVGCGEKKKKKNDSTNEVEVQKVKEENEFETEAKLLRNEFESSINEEACLKDNDELRVYALGAAAGGFLKFKDCMLDAQDQSSKEACLESYKVHLSEVMIPLRKFGPCKDS